MSICFLSVFYLFPICFLSAFYLRLVYPISTRKKNGLATPKKVNLFQEMCDRRKYTAN